MILSLYDYSGQWSAPYCQAGEQVIQVDAGHPTGVLVTDPPTGSYTLGLDLSRDGALEQLLSHLGDQPVRGILAAPPCTVFCKPGARLWKEWDATGKTATHLRLVILVLELVRARTPAMWALENPPGRLANQKGTGLLQEQLGPPVHTFHPWHYAGASTTPETERITKLTYLWGVFNIPSPANLPPKPYPAHLRPGHRDPISQAGSKNKRLRERTPSGFATQFHKANP